MTPSTPLPEQERERDWGRRQAQINQHNLDEQQTEEPLPEQGDDTHVHNWQLAKYVATSVTDGSSYAIFICVCGSREHVTIGDTHGTK